MVGDLAVERYNGTGGGRVNKHWPSDRVGKAVDVCVWQKGIDCWWRGSCGCSCQYEPKKYGIDLCPGCGKTLEQKGVADERD